LTARDMQLAAGLSRCRDMAEHERLAGWGFQARKPVLPQEAT